VALLAPWRLILKSKILALLAPWRLKTSLLSLLG
jgi:hypothetical protein